jgi:hypothetical protein
LRSAFGCSSVSRPDDVVLSVVVVVVLPLDAGMVDDVSLDGVVLFTGWLVLALLGALVVVSGVDCA